MSVTTRKYVPPCEVHKTLWNFQKIEDTLRGAKKRGWQNVCQCNSMTPNFEFRSAGAGTLDRAEFAKWINVRNPLSKSTKRLAFSQKKRQKTIWSCYEKDTQRISLSTKTFSWGRTKTWLTALWVRYVCKCEDFPLSYPYGWARSKTWPTLVCQIRKRGLFWRRIRKNLKFPSQLSLRLSKK